jgi:hypothetical protein
MPMGVHRQKKNMASKLYFLPTWFQKAVVLVVVKIASSYMFQKFVVLAITYIASSYSF